jgi:hypothetical protein
MSFELQKLHQFFFYTDSINPYVDSGEVPWMGHQVIAYPLLAVQNLLGATVRSKTWSLLLQRFYNPYGYV